MLNLFLIILLFMLKIVVKCLFLIVIVVVFYVEKIVLCFFCYVFESKFEYNVKNDRNVMKFRDYCGVFKNGF